MKREPDVLRCVPPGSFKNNVASGPPGKLSLWAASEEGLNVTYPYVYLPGGWTRERLLQPAATWHGRFMMFWQPSNGSRDLLGDILGRKTMSNKTCWCAATLFCLFTFHSVADGEAVTRAARGQPRFPVVVAPGAGQRAREAARELAEYLGRIGGVQFAVEEGDGARGLAVGLFTDFPGLGLA